jgi:hypothetical protein
MNIDLSERSAFESHRQELLGKSPDELSDLFAERFDEEFPSDGLYVGKFPDQVWQFVRTRVRVACDKAAQLGTDVWQALNDEQTAHNAERFALVCGFFASDVLKVGHWPAHEIAALVLLIIATRSKGGASR